ncbi:MAG TPA: PQQ-dependent sugar dehydrogenase [Solirubrobacteraceae bacterium]
MAACLCAAPAPGAVPAGFQNEVVAEIPNFPSAMVILPDGRILVSTMNGNVDVIQNDVRLTTPALSLGNKVCGNREEGLMGIAPDPSFATNGFLYVYYTFNKHGTCGSTLLTGPVNRLSRFKMTGNVIDPASETVLLDNIVAFQGAHNGGDVHFGKDGLLYVMVGDGLCYYKNQNACGELNTAGQELNTLQGKVVRITRTGGIPDTNPYLGADSVQCGTIGFTSDASRKCQEIYAAGVRNPYKAAFDQESATTRFFFNDVGQDTWEEVDAGALGANYGWPMREGACPTAMSTNCPGPPAGITDPVATYHHNTGCSSITGGVFVPTGVWPVEYDRDYLYGDYVCGKVWRKDAPAETGAVTFWADGLWSVLDMEFGPKPSGGQALYYLHGASVQPGQPNQVRRVVYVGGGNRRPVASASGTPSTGVAPLSVQFDGTASSDADGNRLTYAWEFGDGGTGTGATTSHTYTQSGTYQAKLTVTDTAGATDTDTVTIEVGNKPVPVIDAPTTSQKFAVGQQYTLTGHANDAEDGALPATSLKWEVKLHHNTHYHPYVQPVTGNNISFKGPAPEDFSAATNSNLEIRLTATDSSGLSSTVVQDFDPNKVTLTFETAPTGLKVKVNERTLTGPETITSWQGWGLTVDAPTQLKGTRRYVFGSWSDGGAKSHVLTTPATSATYRATFTRQLGTAADFNGDGYDDLAIGAPGEELWGLEDAGVVNVKYGGASGLGKPGPGELQFHQSAAFGLSEQGDQWGAALTTGDFNNDGYSDLAVGAPGEDLAGLARAGAVNVLYGSATGLNGGPNPRQFFQSDVAGANEAGDRFGAALAAGDFDGDGRDDLVASAPGENFYGVPDAGVVNVQYGSANGVDGNDRGKAQEWSQNSFEGLAQDGDRFGTALAAGDFDGDGRADLVAGAPGEDYQATASGMVNVMYGTASGLAGSVRARQIPQEHAAGLPEQSDRFGAALTTADFNGDGRSELVAGAPGEDWSGNAGAGVVNVLYGTTTGFTNPQQLRQADAAGAEEPGDGWGGALTAGDFNADGREDLAAAAPNENYYGIAGAGVVNVMYGGASGLTRFRPQDAQEWSQNSWEGLAQAGDHFGSAITTGDYDGDRRSDLVGGAPNEAFQFVDSGMVNVMYGTATGLAGSTKAAQFAQSQSAGLTEAGDLYGAAMGTSTWTDPAVAPAAATTSRTMLVESSLSTPLRWQKQRGRDWARVKKH